LHQGDFGLGAAGFQNTEMESEMESEMEESEGEEEMGRQLLWCEFETPVLI